MLLFFLNQLVHGHLGLLANNQDISITIEIINTLSSLLDYNTDTKLFTKNELPKQLTYSNLLNSSASKALFKYSELLESHINNPNEKKIPGNYTSEEIITIIKTITPLLKRITSPKLSKPLVPIIKTLELFHS